MILAPTRPVLVCSLLLSALSAAPQGGAKQAKAFLPARAGLAELVSNDARTGKPKERIPAVLEGSLVSPGSKEIVFAYTTQSSDLQWSTLFVTVLHEANSGYVKLAEFGYQGRSLWVQDFTTVGLRLIRLPGDQTDSIVVVTGRGASLGAQMQLLRWKPGLGFVNVRPENNSVRRVTFKEEETGLVVVLSFEKYPGEKDVPAALAFRWEGGKFVKAH